MSETTDTVAEIKETTETSPITATEVVEAVETKKKLPLTEDDVMEALQKVIDPELHMNIVELGLIYNVDVQQNANDTKDVNVEMTLTSPGCPFGPVIMGQIPMVVKNDFPGEVDEVNVSLTFAPPWDPSTMASEDVKFELGIF